MQARSAHERWCSRDESSTIVVAVNAQLLRQLKLQQLQRPPSKRKNLLRSKIQLRSRAVMNAAFTKELVALMPTCMLLCGAMLGGFLKIRCGSPSTASQRGYHSPERRKETAPYDAV